MAMRLCWWLPFVAACGGEDPTGGADDESPVDSETTADSGTFVPASNVLDVLDVNNFTYSETWAVGEHDVIGVNCAIVPDAQTAPRLSWFEVDQDVRGNAFDPTQAGQLVLAQVSYDETELSERLALGTYLDGALGLWSAEVGGLTSLLLSDLVLAASTDAFVPGTQLCTEGNSLWLAVLGSADLSRIDPLHVAVLKPVVAGPTLVDLAAVPSTFSWTSSSFGEPLLTSEVHDEWDIDWSGLTVDAYGRPFNDVRFVSDELFLGRYDEPVDLASDVLNLESLAADWFVFEFDREGVDDMVVEARDAGAAGGSDFDGLTTDGDWIVGVRCASCPALVPFWVAPLDVEAAPEPTGDGGDGGAFGGAGGNMGLP